MQFRTIYTIETACLGGCLCSQSSCIFDAKQNMIQQQQQQQQNMIPLLTSNIGISVTEGMINGDCCWAIFSVL